MNNSLLEHLVIYAAPDNYALVPSIQLDRSGALYAVFRNAPWHAEAIYTHLDVRSTALLKRSDDGGKTWQIVGQPVTGHLPLSGVQDPSLTILADGTFLLTYFHWRYSPYRAGAQKGTIKEGVWVRKSNNKGLTWDAPRHVPLSPGTEMCISEPPFELADGTLLLPGYAFVGERQEASFISRSTDGGDT